MKQQLKMLNIDEALKLRNPESIRNEISERAKLINIMVGNLYPQILEDEIFRLKELLSKIIIQKECEL